MKARGPLALWNTLGVALAASLMLAGCESTLSPLFMPMEPSRASMAAPRRDLTEAEKELISEAVSAKLDPLPNRDFTWARLIVSPQDRGVIYCGKVRRENAAVSAEGLGRYYVRLIFDGRGKLTKVEVGSIAKSRNNGLPTEVDSICAQAGYGGLS